jgi:hypothetical protein
MLPHGAAPAGPVPLVLLVPFRTVMCRRFPAHERHIDSRLRLQGGKASSSKLGLRLLCGLDEPPPVFLRVSSHRGCLQASYPTVDRTMLLLERMRSVRLHSRMYTSCTGRDVPCRAVDDRQGRCGAADVAHPLASTASCAQPGHAACACHPKTLFLAAPCARSRWQGSALESAARSPRSETSSAFRRRGVRCGSGRPPGAP